LTKKVQKLSTFFEEFEDVKKPLFKAFQDPKKTSNIDKEKEIELSEKLKNTMNFIYWKHNPENNTKFLTSNMHFFNDKTLQKFEASWLSEFNIGNIMYLKKINLNMFQPGSQLDFINDINFLIDLLLYLR